jgi:hypothetical protein
MLRACEVFNRPCAEGINLRSTRRRRTAERAREKERNTARRGSKGARRRMESGNESERERERERERGRARERRGVTDTIKRRVPSQWRMHVKREAAGARGRRKTGRQGEREKRGTYHESVNEKSETEGREMRVARVKRRRGYRTRYRIQERPRRETSNDLAKVGGRGRVTA